MNLEFNSFIQWIFYGLISFISLYGVKILSSLKDSVEKLNVKMAVIIERHEWHQREIDDIKTEIKALKSKAR